MTTAVPRLGADVLDDLDRRLAPAGAERAARYPGDAGTRQPVHTVYVPADQMTPDVPADWGALALATLGEHAPGATLAEATGLDPALAARVLPDVLAKLEREPVEDLRIDFEDGYGPRPPTREDADALAAAAALAGALARAAAPPHPGLRIRSLEAATRRRGLRTLDLFLGGLLAETRLPDGFVVTLPKVTDARLVRRSLERGWWQGWDLHPAQPPTRYLATYAFFREGLPAAAARLRAWVERTGGGVLDEPATAQALARFLARGLDCGGPDRGRGRRAQRARPGRDRRPDQTRRPRRRPTATRGGG